MTLIQAFIVTLVGCGSAPEAPPPAPEAPFGLGSNAPVPDAKPVALVDVAADGSRYSPPVPKAAIPGGAYYCDMGVVHYASKSKGDGTCPVCEMKLSKRPDAAGKPAATDGRGDHDDHGH